MDSIHDALPNLFQRIFYQPAFRHVHLDIHNSSGLITFRDDILHTIQGGVVIFWGWLSVFERPWWNIYFPLTKSTSQPYINQISEEILLVAQSFWIDEDF